MKKNAKMVMLLVTVSLLASFAIACATAPASSEGNNSGSEFSPVMGKEWNLAELRSNSGTIRLDRAKLTTENFGDIYTLRFDDKLASGKGAPNTYRGPYSLAAGQAISIGPMASTLMAAIFEPEELKEHEFYTLMQNVYRWNISGTNLELHSRDGTRETVLVFVPR
jgi:heat shock protein HslJ